MNILLISLLGCFVVALSSAGAQKVKWCVTSQNEMKKCQDLTTKAPELECLLKSSVTECMLSIKEGEADAITVDGQHIYQAGLRPYDFRPVIVQKSKKKCCYAVADTDFTINDLKGKTSCHSCYQRPGGWNIPIGRLVAQNKIPWDSPDDMPLEKAVSQFFSSSCIPGISKAQYPNLCQACQGDCSCSQNEKYYSDEGALQCLKSGHGQVAFVCQDAIPPGNPSALPQDRPIEWCTISHPEQQKCDKISSLIPLIKCQRASSVEECIKKIKHREADAIAVDSSHILLESVV